MDLNFKLHPAQLSIFNSKARFRVVPAGRRFGKSYLSAVISIVEALKDKNEAGYNLKGKDVWYVAPTFNQAKDIMWSVLKDLGEDVIERTVSNEGIIQLINGRKIQLKGADRPDTMRGSGLSLVIMDEFADTKSGIFEEIILPTLTDVKGKALLIGTPKGKNHFYDAFERGGDDAFPDWESFHFVTKDNPFISRNIIDEARGIMSEAAFRAEFEASFTNQGEGLFNADMIKYGKEPAYGDYFIAVDPAGFVDLDNLSKGTINKLDETAIAVVKVNEDGWWVKDIDAGRWSIQETVNRILRHVKENRAVHLGIEKGSLKAAIMPYLKEAMGRTGVFVSVKDLSHGGTAKAERITWALQGRFENGRITLNKGQWVEAFKTQLLDFPSKLTHDDLPDALAYIDQLSKQAYGVDLDIDTWGAMDDLSGY
jgi:hypothetical protein